MHGIHSGGAPSNATNAVLVGASLSSLLVDFQLRATGLANLYGPTIDSLPLPEFGKWEELLVQKFLELNCLTEAYAPLWKEITGQTWTYDTPLRNAWDRQLAQIEIDAIVAHSLGITADELCMIYRTQFPVMRRYDEEDRYDANGRLIPKEILNADARLKDGQELSEADRTWVHSQSKQKYVFAYPFRKFDREKYLRQACEKYV
ncbi:hypothetical protein COGO111599_11310 [Corynebacterium gottingense]